MFDPGAPPNKPVSSTRLAELLDRFDSITDLNLPGIELDGLEIQNSSFHGCNFSGAKLYNCRITNCSFDLCFFDFSSHAHGLYTNLTITNSVFACSNLDDVRFTGSNLIQCNFNAISGGGIIFDDCDLLHSRFDGCTRVSMEIENCNLKETRFIRTPPGFLTIAHSNEEDAMFVDPEAW